MKKYEDHGFYNFIKEEEKIVEYLFKKYEDLVWYARSNPKDWGNNEIINRVLRIEKLYPEETELLGKEEGCWQHGFNSGCLAIFRLYEHPLGIHEASLEFPMLDT